MFSVNSVYLEVYTFGQLVARGFTFNKYPIPVISISSNPVSDSEDVIGSSKKLERSLNKISSPLFPSCPPLNFQRHTDVLYARGLNTLHYR